MARPASDYLSLAEELGDMAMKAGDPHRESLYLGAAQATAIQAVAAAIERLAAAVEVTGGRP
jgi:hypothetical protein